MVNIKRINKIWVFPEKCVSHATVSHWYQLEFLFKQIPCVQKKLCMLYSIYAPMLVFFLYCGFLIIKGNVFINNFNIPWFEMLFVILLLNTNRKVYKFQNDKMHSLHNYSYSKNSSIALLKCFNWFLCATYIFNCILLHSLSIKSYAIRLKLYIKTGNSFCFILPFWLR
jgi:hypothetical protein